ncbi:hypothetical protein BASA82_000501 [Batrachochytrium salamandrivorans]|nr:hypothetical protein BASA82_000501 [Batrachochytrium salamandrivorans]
MSRTSTGRYLPCTAGSSHLPSLNLLCPSPLPPPPLLPPLPPLPPPQPLPKRVHEDEGWIKLTLLASERGDEEIVSVSVLDTEPCKRVGGYLQGGVCLVAGAPKSHKPPLARQMKTIDLCPKERELPVELWYLILLYLPDLRSRFRVAANLLGLRICLSGARSRRRARLPLAIVFKSYSPQVPPPVSAPIRTISVPRGVLCTKNDA